MTEDIRVNRNKIRQFKCRNCGGELQLMNKRSQYVACPYCGSVADSSSEAYKVLTKMENPSKFPPLGFIKIGMEGVFNNKVHYVVGRTRRRNSYREFWSESGAIGYSDEIWVFDEWLLISEDGTFFTLVEDAEGFTVVQPITPKYPSIPQGEKMQDFYSGKSRRVQEYGDTEIMYYEGESTYMVQIGDKSSFSEYIGEDYESYSAEWRYKDGEIKEIEFFRENEISDSDVQNAFGLSSQKKSPKSSAKAPKSREKRLRNRYIILVGALINLFIGFWGSSNTHTSKLMNDTIYVSEVVSAKGWMPVNDTLKSTHFQKKLDINPTTKLISFKFMQGNLPDSTSCIADIALISKDKSDTLYTKTAYSYNYSKKTKDLQYVAYKVDKVVVDFLRNDSLNSLLLDVTIKVPKYWEKKPYSSRLKDIGLEFIVKESNSGNPDKGAGNITLGFFLLIGAIILLIARKKY